MNKKLSMEELGRMTPGQFHQANKIPVVVILENIRSGLNVGSIFRSSDAFRIEGIFCIGYTPTPPHREVLKTALGATESVNWEHRDSTLPLLAELKQNNVQCYAIEQATDSIELRTFDPHQKPIAIILGNEVTGVEQSTIEACDGVIEISQHGTKHSLNVAVCGGIVLFELFGKYNL